MVTLQLFKGVVVKEWLKGRLKEPVGFALLGQISADCYRFSRAI
jgi:hypothetical protein